jgi:hypothetical protein
VLTPRPAGGYAYKGRGFDATIDADGSVHMKDTFVSLGLPFKARTAPDGTSWTFTFLEFKFDPYSWLDRKIGKNDPYRSERVWFLERTRELRERLFEQRAPTPQR